SRALLTAAFWAITVATVGIPATLLLGRAVGIGYVWPAFAVAALFSGWIAWRKAGTVDHELESGGLLMLKTIAGQGFEDSEHGVRPTLPGIKHLLEVHLGPTDHAVQRTLTDLDLRARTGASVVAISDETGSTTIPSGTQPLRAGQ